MAEVREGENAFFDLEDQIKKYFLGGEQSVVSETLSQLAGDSAKPQNLASRTSPPPRLPVNLAGSRHE